GRGFGSSARADVARVNATKATTSIRSKASSALSARPTVLVQREAGCKTPVRGSRAAALQGAMRCLLESELAGTAANARVLRETALRAALRETALRAALRGTG